MGLKWLPAQSDVEECKMSLCLDYPNHPVEGLEPCKSVSVNQRLFCHMREWSCWKLKKLLEAKR